MTEYYDPERLVIMLRNTVADAATCLGAISAIAGRMQAIAVSDKPKHREAVAGLIGLKNRVDEAADLTAQIRRYAETREEDLSR